MVSFRFLAVKRSAQKKQTSYGALGFFISTGSRDNLDVSKSFTAVRSLYGNGTWKMLVSCPSMQGKLNGTDQNSHLPSCMVVKLGVFT